ncbi:MAG: hypothetical protein IKZ09_01310 [Clostridia bacterium]|nr:hypothetical protein [Clostridia bacterium]
MNHAKPTVVTVRRVLQPLISDRQKDPLVLRRTYDISAVCGRSGDKSGDGAVLMRVRGTKTTPLVRCIAVGAALVVGIAAIAACCRIRQSMRLQRKLARRYADQYQKKLYRIRRRAEKTASDRQTSP